MNIEGKGSEMSGVFIERERLDFWGLIMGLIISLRFLSENYV